MLEKCAFWLVLSVKLSKKCAFVCDGHFCRTNRLSRTIYGVLLVGVMCCTILRSFLEFIRVVLALPLPERRTRILKFFWSVWNSPHSSGQAYRAGLPNATQSLGQGDKPFERCRCCRRCSSTCGNKTNPQWKLVTTSCVLHMTLVVYCTSKCRSNPRGCQSVWDVCRLPSGDGV